MGRWPEFVQIKEVGPRDGLQNEKKRISTPDKVNWINMLSESGVKEIEYSSFVHPKWIPQLADAHEVGRKIKRNPEVRYSALVPNMKGLELALETGIDGASVFMSASEAHNKKNINKSIDETSYFSLDHQPHPRSRCLRDDLLSRPENERHRRRNPGQRLEQRCHDGDRLSLPRR